MQDLDRAISLAGGVTKLARLLQVGKSAIGNWRRRGKVPPKQAIAIHLLLGLPLNGLAAMDLASPVANPTPGDAPQQPLMVQASTKASA